MDRYSIQFATKYSDIKPINDEFVQAKCWVCALGKNRNLSYIGEEAAHKAEDSLWNIPVVAHLYTGEDGKYHVGGHDVSVVSEGNGAYLKDLTVPFGVVPFDPANIKYEKVVEPDGEEKTYVTCNVIIWAGRYPEILEAINKEDGSWNQSMEITAIDYDQLVEDPNYIDIKEYQYSALCLLGRSKDAEYNVEPCFPEAKVTISNFSLDDNNFTELFAQLKKELTACFAKDSEVVMTAVDELGNTVEETEVEEAQEEVEPEEVVEDMAEEVVEETPETDITETVVDETEPADETIVTVDETPVVEMAVQDGFELAEVEVEPVSSYKQKLQVFIDYFRPYDIIESGEVIGKAEYYVFDFTDNYVYVTRHDHYSATKEEKEKHFRYEYTIDENNYVTVFNETECVVSWLTQAEADEVQRVREERDVLITYKAQREHEDKIHSYVEALKEFSDMTGNEEYDSIVANKESYDSVDELKNACYIVRGKYGLVANAKKPTVSEPMIPVEHSSEQVTTARERLHALYGKR